MPVTTSSVRLQTISAVVRKIEYHSVDSGFSILCVQTEVSRESIKMFGTVTQVTVGDLLQATGIWHEVDGRMAFNAFDIKKAA